MKGMKKKPVAGMAMGMEKASKGMGKASTSAFKKKGMMGMKDCPKISKIG